MPLVSLLDRAGVGRHIAAAAFDLDLHVQLAAGGDMGDDVIGIDDLDVVASLDVASGDDAFAGLGERQHRLAAVVHLEHDALQVEHQVDDVLAHAVQRGVLVQHPRC
jgi:hypothetical protein